MLDMQKFAEDCAKAIELGSYMADGESDEYQQALWLFLTVVGRRLELEGDDLNRAVVGCLFALGIENNPEPLYLRMAEREKDHG